MKKCTALKRIKRIPLNTLFVFFILTFCLTFFQVFANSTQIEFEQDIEEGILNIYFVDTTVGEVQDIFEILETSIVTDPNIPFPSLSFSFNPQDSSSTLGSPEQTIRIDNATSNTGFDLALAPEIQTSFEIDGYWMDGENSYPIHSENQNEGALTVDPSNLNIDAFGCDSESVNPGSLSSFLFIGAGNSENVESIDLLNASDSAFCRVDVTGIDLLQRIPGRQEPGQYNLNMVLTATATVEEVLGDLPQGGMLEMRGTNWDVHYYDYIHDIDTNMRHEDTVKLSFLVSAVDLYYDEWWDDDWLEIDADSLRFNLEFIPLFNELSSAAIYLSFSGGETNEGWDVHIEDFLGEFHSVNGRFVDAYWYRVEYEMTIPEMFNDDRITQVLFNIESNQHTATPNSIIWLDDVRVYHNDNLLFNLNYEAPATNPPPLPADPPWGQGFQIVEADPTPWVRYGREAPSYNHP
jgi:hypothetical protein